MNSRIVQFFLLSVVVIMISSCGADSSKDSNKDTSARKSFDTTMIPGTPGPSGTTPRPSDTTQGHRDSLKHEANIADSSKPSVSKP